MGTTKGLTYKSALSILGKHDLKSLKILDALLGGIILASPALGLIPGASAILALWGWVDQKNEAVDLLQKLLDKARGRLHESRGVERHQLIAAAHTTIVFASYFEVIRSELGDDQYESLRISAQEMITLGTGGTGDLASDQISQLYNAHVPIPSATCGFHAICTDVLPKFYEELDRSTRDFIRGLAAWDNTASLQAHLKHASVSNAEKAARKYSENFVKLAAEIPEFFVWSLLTEHSTTQTELNGLQRQIRDLIQSQSRALDRVELLLQLGNPGIPTQSERRRSVHATNRSALRADLVPIDSLKHIEGIAFPSVEEIYVSPRYQLTTYNPSTSRLAEDAWWERVDVKSDIETFLASYFMSPNSTSAPLLILGHPGAGKSLLTKILAARLRIDSFTVVRVQLRNVDAEAPIYLQIQQALEAQTHGRISWSRLSDESSDAIRVVLLDGLDELIQATTKGRVAYLQDVAEFQRREADLERPVVVVVTARTVVTDRLRITRDSAVVRIREFDESRIDKWLTVWNRCNHGLSGISELDPSVAKRHLTLASQPLLLLMLALYAADPGATSLDRNISGADLYKLLLENFVMREISKSNPNIPIEMELASQIWHLGIAAFGMFNRGRQSITAEELGADIGVLAPSSELKDWGNATPTQIGQQTIGRFFFIHTSEADAHRTDEVHRSYEFLHATFSEFLIAHHLVQLILEASTPRGTYYPGAPREVDDTVLRSLLSCHTLSLRRSILAFTREIASKLSTTELGNIQATLSKLIKSSRNPSHTSSTRYPPSQRDSVNETAAYSINLVLLRVFLAWPSMPVPLSDFLATRKPGTRASWQSLLRLWRAGLDPVELDSIADTLVVEQSAIAARVDPPHSSLPGVTRDLAYAQLSLDTDLELTLRAGMAARKSLALEPSDSFHLQLQSYLIAALLYGSPGGTLDELFDQGVTKAERSLRLLGQPGEQNKIVQDLVVRYLAGNNPKSSPYSRIRALTSILGPRIFDAPVRPDGSPTCPSLSSAVTAHPRLLEDFPGLRRPSLYLDPSSEKWIWMVLHLGENQSNPQYRPHLTRLRLAIQEHLYGEPTEISEAMIAAYMDSRLGRL